MKKTIKLSAWVMVMFISFTLNGVVEAQGRGHQGPPKAPTSEEIIEMVADMAEVIELSENQTSLVQDMYIAHYQEMEKKMSSSRPERSEMEEFEESFNNDIKALLDDEQVTKYEAFLMNNKPDRSKR